MIRWALLVLAVGLLMSGCAGRESGPPSRPATPEGAAEPLVLEDHGPAPELAGEVWMNAEGPLRLADLRGEVVLLEMWTFGCINCQRVIPHLREWQARYQPEGLVVIGNHYPEFPYEEDLGNLRAALDRFEIEYAVVQDNEGVNWRAYRNRYWPTTYLIDKQGRLRYQHIGEGAYGRTEAAIQALLAE